MRIAIFIDSRFRDTLSCLLVKQALEKSRPNWDLLAVSIDLWQPVLELFKPHVVILNHAIGFRNKQIISRADYAIVLPTEGRPNTREQEDWFVNEQDGVADLYLSWNKLIADKFKRTKAVVTGCPRFDVYHTHTHLIDSKEKARAKYRLGERKTIGVFTSFPQAKFSFSNVEFNRNDWRDLGVNKISTRQDPLEFAKQEYRARREFLNAVAALSDEFPSYQFLVKPHPMEDVLEIQEWADNNGFTCVTQDTIYNVIAACDFVINRIGCVTTLDSWLSGVQTISFGEPEAEGLAYQSGDDNLAYSVSDLIDIVSNYLDGEQIKHGKKYINDCGLGEAATSRVAKAIIAELDDISTINRPTTFVDRIKLETMITQHNGQFIVPNPLVPPVGKAAINGYIANVEATL